MKNLLMLLIVVCFLASCDIVTFDDNINDDPNLPTDATASQLLANAMLSLPGVAEDPQGEYMAQFLSKTIYQDNSFYPPQPTGFYSWYQGPLMNVQTVIANSDDPNSEAVAKILKAYFYWHLTDRWGDIPYSEALQGTEDITPAYARQSVIYDSLFVLLEEANNQIDTGGTLADDIIYDGDMGKWKRLANTIHLLMALRLTEVDPALGEAEFNEALEAGIMTSNEDNLVFNNLLDANNQSFWYGQIVQAPIREWWALSEGLVSLMRPANDPRLPVYGDPVGNASSDYEYVGLPYGTPGSINNANYSLLGDAIHAQDATVYLVTYAQALFAKAEAAARGWIPGDAETFYKQAIEHSILQWTGSTDGLEAFLNAPEIAFDPAIAIQQIAEQRYVHLFMHGYEAWAEWRRTGYPQTMNMADGNEVPRRQMYSAEERLNNTENYQEAIDQQFGGENTLYGRMWWDVE